MTKNDPRVAWHKEFHAENCEHSDDTILSDFHEKFQVLIVYELKVTENVFVFKNQIMKM
jgi:hypothetical protein